MLEQAREAMEAGLNNSSSAPSDTPTPNQNQSASSESAPTKQPQAQQPLVDLDKVDRFIYGGKEMTRDELKKFELRQQDYTRKMQALAQDREKFETDYKGREQQLTERQNFIDNLEADLEHVSKDPSLAAKFKELYPPEYHKYLRYAGHQDSASTLPQQAQSQEQKFQIPPEIQAKLNQVDTLQNYITEQEVRVVNEKLDVLFPTFREKYNLADEGNVIAMAQALHQQGTKLDDSMWEKIWKNDHERLATKFADYQKSLNKKQIEANDAGRDIAAGGGIPGQAPKKAKSFKEATDTMIRDLGGRR